VKKRKSSSGGAALHLGSGYQARVATRMAVEILAEGQGRPFSPGGRIALLRGETQESVDDLLVGTVSDCCGFIQAKRKVSFSDLPNRELTSVLDQVVRQVLRGTMTGFRVLGVDHSCHPLTAFCSSRVHCLAKNINVVLREVLNRAASLAPGQPLIDAAVTDEQKRILKVTEATVRIRWTAATGRVPSDREVLSVFAL
jgi:hypothetical protein